MAFIKSLLIFPVLACAETLFHFFQVVVEKAPKSSIQDIDKRKFLVPSDLTGTNISVYKGCFITPLFHRNITVLLNVMFSFQWHSLCTSSGKEFNYLQKKPCSFSSTKSCQRPGRYIHKLIFLSYYIKSINAKHLYSLFEIINFSSDLLCFEQQTRRTLKTNTLVQIDYRCSSRWCEYIKLISSLCCYFCLLGVFY